MTGVWSARRRANSRDASALAAWVVVILLVVSTASCGDDESPDAGWNVAGTWTGSGRLYFLEGTTALGMLEEVFELTQDGDRVSGTLTEQGFGSTFRFAVSGTVTDDVLTMEWSGPDHCSPPGRYTGPATRVDDDRIRFVVRGSDCDGAFRVEGEIARGQ